ncbi:MAG TPA: ABC transporter ATP-binding protein [Gammaproteobacteria bacterium]
MTIPVVEINAVSKSYGRKQVLSDISLSISEGEYIGLVGLNGAGKTTLIKCLLDFCALDSGQIRIFGREHRDTESRKSLVFLPEKFIPPYFLKGNDFLKYMAALYQINVDNELIDSLLQVMDLDAESLDQPVYKYSKGMSQKLGLIASLMTGRQLLVYDEPMSGLDPRARARLKKHLLSLKSAGQTLFYSSHLLEDVKVMCDRLVILHYGQVRFFGTLDECIKSFTANDLEEAYLHCIDQ